MGEGTIGERLEWIRTRYFKTQQQMAEAMGCESSYLTKILKPGEHNLGRSMIVNLFNVMKSKEPMKVLADDLSPGWIMFGGERASFAPPQGSSLRDVYSPEVSDEDLANTLRGIASAFVLRRYNEIAKGLVDLIKQFDAERVSSGGGAPSHPKVSDAVADLSQARPAKQPKR